MVNLYFREFVTRLRELSVYGNSRQIKISKEIFKKETLRNNSFNPTIFLSTGRTGTKFFNQLLNLNDDIHAIHTAKVDLVEQSKIVYEAYKEFGINNNMINDIVAQIYLSCRENTLYETYLHKKKFVELNNRVTFLTPGIKKWMPGTKFVYLYRHPGEFIRSGLRRGWYKGAPHDIGRIVPNESQIVLTNKNEDLKRIEKIAWLWNETNTFIESFIETLPQKDIFKVNFSEINESIIQEVLIFLQVDISLSTIRKRLKNPVNEQIKGHFPEYKKWNTEQKQIVKNICGDLADRYNYHL